MGSVPLGAGLPVSALAKGCVTVCAGKQSPERQRAGYAWAIASRSDPSLALGALKEVRFRSPPKSRTAQAC